MNNEKMSSFKSFKVNLKTFKLLIRKFPQLIISNIIYNIWTSLTPYVGIYLSAILIDELTSEKCIEKIKWLVIIILVSAAIISLVTALLNKWKKTYNNVVYYNRRGLFVEKLLDMDYPNTDSTDNADLLYRIEQNQNGGGWGLDRVIDQYNMLLTSIFTIIGGIALTISLFLCKVPSQNVNFLVLNDPLVSIFVILLLILLSLIAPLFEDKARSYYSSNSNLHNFGNRLFGFYGYLGYQMEKATDIRIYRQDKICEKYFNSKENVFGSKGFFAKLARGKMGILSVLSAITSVLIIGFIYLFVGLKAWAGAFGIGAVTKYITSISQVSSGLTKLFIILGDMKVNAYFLEEVFEFLNIPNTMYQGSLTVEKRNDNDYEIEFRGVSFKYPGSDDFVLKNINMKFKIGTKMAIVGMNGSGKTTFIKLLCRLYDPTEGEILLNGINIKKYDYLDYLNIFSVVFQDYTMFGFTVGENVAMKTDYDETLVKSSLEKVGFTIKLSKMKNGLDTYISHEYDKSGVDISGGEAQKIAIARAVYKNSPFVILDEPTASLDPIAEAEIYSKFNELVKDKTTMYISHRLSSCKFCNEILVFDKGDIVQQGTHENLLKDKDGKYFELWNAQAQYYNK